MVVARKFTKGFVGVWSDFPMSPSECMRKVTEGKLKILKKDKYGRWLYEVIEDFELE